MLKDKYKLLEINNNILSYKKRGKCQSVEFAIIKLFQTTK